MPAFILLTEENRAHVLGPALNPIARQGGGAHPDPVYILNTLVLADPQHEAFWAYLGALPTMDLADPDFPAELPADDPAGE